MKTRRGWVQGYNAQAVVTPRQIILAADVTSEANDVNQLTVMLDQAQVNVEAVTGESAVLGAAVADAGYWSQANAGTRERGMRVVHCDPQGSRSACRLARMRRAAGPHTGRQ